MKKVSSLSLALLVWVTLAGCIATDPSKDYDGALSYGMGLQSEQHGDLVGARNYFAKAMKNAKSGRLGPAKEAYATYGWARTSGYLGAYADAERGFNEALAAIDRAEGDADSLRAPVLFDMARMFHDIGQHAKAVSAFAKAFAELDRRGGIDLIQPWAYIGFLEDYAASQKANGSPAAADDLLKRAAAMKEQIKGTQPRVAVRRYNESTAKPGAAPTPAPK